MTDRFNAPTNATDAGQQLAELVHDLETARNWARKYRNAADRAEHIYQREKAKAAIRVEGPNADVRDGKVHEWELGPDARADSVEVSQAMGLDAGAAETVGELRWLRDRARSLADEWSATAYDRRASIGAWTTVAAMTRTEAELSHVGAA